ncbi:MAG: SurA N-terminal domain-containing protein [Thermodesulfobacteriota bacterium]
MRKILSLSLLAAALVCLVPSGSGAEVVDRIVAIINESIITLSELNAATAVAVDRLGVEGGKDPKKAEEIKGKILDSLIEQKLVKQASDKAGIDVSEREIDNAIEDVKKQNRMTQETLLLALARSGLTYKEYREQMKEQIRQVKYIDKEFRSKISIQKEDLEDYYRQNLDEFMGPASYRINMIYISGEDPDRLKLKRGIVESALARGDDFRDIAGHYSEGPAASMGGDLGYMRSGEMNEKIEAEAARLAPGGVSGPIEMEGGVYYIQVVDTIAAAPRPFADVKNKIYSKLFKKIMDERFNFWLEEVKKYAHIEIRR